MTTAVNQVVTKRVGLDCYITPGYAVEKLIKHLPLEVLNLKIWEPAVGPGAIASILQGYGAKTICSDIMNYGFSGTVVQDFLACENLLAPTIMTNPPFNKGLQFIEHALSLNPKHLYLLLRFNAYTPRKYSQVMSDKRLVEIFPFRKRLGFHLTMDKSDKPRTGVDYAWFHWCSRKCDYTKIKAIEDV